jgi:hypothetical protein
MQHHPPRPRLRAAVLAGLLATGLAGVVVTTTHPEWIVGSTATAGLPGFVSGDPSGDRPGAGPRLDPGAVDEWPGADASPVEEWPDEVVPPVQEWPVQEWPAEEWPSEDTPVSDGPAWDEQETEEPTRDAPGDAERLEDDGSASGSVAGSRGEG